MVEENLILLGELNKDQLFAGQDAKGNLLTPSYLNDPYFKTPVQAKKYSDWKDGINQRKPSDLLPKRPSGTPNLIINGKLVYDELYASLTGDKIRLAVNSVISDKLKAKYGDYEGLSDISLDYFINEKVYPSLINDISKIIHGM